MKVLAATDFFTTEVWTKSGLVTYYILFFIHVATRKVHVAGLTPHPNEEWMVQIARVGAMDNEARLIQRSAITNRAHTNP